MSAATSIDWLQLQQTLQAMPLAMTAAPPAPHNSSPISMPKLPTVDKPQQEVLESSAVQESHSSSPKAPIPTKLSHDLASGALAMFEGHSKTPPTSNQLRNGYTAMPEISDYVDINTNDRGNAAANVSPYVPQHVIQAMSGPFHAHLERNEQLPTAPSPAIQPEGHSGIAAYTVEAPLSVAGSTVSRTSTRRRATLLARLSNKHKTSSDTYIDRPQSPSAAASTAQKVATSLPQARQRNVQHPNQASRIQVQPSDPFAKALKHYVESNRGAICDVLFIVGPERRQVPAVSLLLSAQSQVFADMFHAHVAAHTTAKLTVTLPSVHPGAFASVVGFCHCGEVSVDVPDIAATQKLAEQYQLPALQAACAASLRGALSVGNAWFVLQQATCAGDTTLALKAARLIARRAAILLRPPLLLKASVGPVALALVLEQDALTDVSEDELYDFVLCWGRLVTLAGTSTALLEDLVRKPLGKLRLPLMSPQKLASQVARDGLVPAADVLQAVSFTSGLISGDEPPCPPRHCQPTPRD